MDSDTMVARGAHEAVLSKFRRGELDVLVGTQMIAKGLDFPSVTVVGVVSADTALHLPDFRSAERTFQLVSQVAGRAGRGPKGGEVFVQTREPDHPAIRGAVENDYEAFAERELEDRRELGYPPFGRLVRIVVEGRDEEKVRAAAERIRDRLLGIDDGGRGGAAAASALLPFDDPAAPAPLLPAVEGTALLGPAPAPIERIRGRARWHLLLKVVPPERLAELRPALHAVALASWSGVEVTLDVDPASVL
jgi:primosomal protein N' (replication factor Y)